MVSGVALQVEDLRVSSRRVRPELSRYSLTQLDLLIVLPSLERSLRGCYANAGIRLIGYYFAWLETRLGNSNPAAGQRNRAETQQGDKT